MEKVNQIKVAGWDGISPRLHRTFAKQMSEPDRRPALSVGVQNNHATLTAFHWLN